MIASPSSGSSARISTAAGKPSRSVTALRHQWIPYVKYTYAVPGEANMLSLRAVRRAR